MIVDDFEFGDLAVVLGVRGQRVRIADGVEPELDVAGGERRAVGPVHVVAQMEDDLEPVFGDVPRLGQTRFQVAQRLVVRDQTVEQVGGDLVRRAVAGKHRDQIRRVADAAEQDRVAVSRLRGRGGCGGVGGCG